MTKQKNPIGGEPYYSPLKFVSFPKRDIKQYFSERFPGKKLLYSYGGYYSLRIILRHLNISGDDKILVPSYMCPSILYPFKELGLKYEFYKVNNQLVINIDDLLKRITSNTKAILFINYFGFNQPEEVKKKLLKIKSNGIILLQDVVQDFYVSSNEILGNYAFMSFRKFFPCEGSVIISDKEINDVVVKGKNKSYFRNKLKGRFGRYLHYKYGCNEKHFLDAFAKAHDTYYSPEDVALTKYDEYILNRIEFKTDMATRRNNYNKLLNRYGEKAVLKALPDDVVPLLFPMTVDDRDNLQKQLRKNNIFCPVHWKLTDEFSDEVCDESVKLSKTIISMPINNLETDYQTLNI